MTVIDQLSLSLSSLQRLRRNDGDVQSGFLGILNFSELMGVVLVWRKPVGVA